MQLVSIADIVGGGAAVALSATESFCRALFVTALGGNARIGDASVSAAQGVACIQNVPESFYADPDDMSARIDLSRTKAYVPNGTTLTISYLA